MIDEKMDQESDGLPEVEETVVKSEVEIPKEETTEETTEEPEVQSEEPEKEPITLDKTFELAQALQKGYTLTRQDMAEIKRNQQAIQEALSKINESKEFVDEDAPLTVKGFLKLQDEQRNIKVNEDRKINQQIEDQLDDLRVRGVIKTKADEDAVLNYAISEKKQGKNKDLITAGLDWQELQKAKLEGAKAIAQVKTKVKQDAGSKIGTSQKTKIEKEEGFNYEEIHNKDMSELISE